MPTYNVQAAVTLRPLPEACGYLAAPPVSWPTLASDWNLDPDTDIDGRYIQQNVGEAQGVPSPKRQDTYISGTSGRTGRAFNVISGSWKDDLVDPQQDVYGLLMPDSSAEISWEIRSAAITPQIEAADIIIRRGIPPANDDAARARTGYTCYLELAYNASDSSGYRLAFEWGRPIRLDSTDDNGVTWSAVCIARSLGNLERYLAGRGGLLRLRVMPDTSRGRLSVEIGDEAVLVHTSTAGVLPAPGSLRLYGKNGSIRFSYLPLRSQPVTVSGAIATNRDQPNAASAFLTFNGPAQPPAGQSILANLGSDGQTFTWNATASAPDAGDGLGSVEPPTLASATLIVPALWTDGVDLVPDPIGALELPVRSVEEVQVFDDAARTLTTSALVTADNQDGRFATAYGNRYVEIRASIGGPYSVRFRGIAGANQQGIDLSTTQSLGRMSLPCRGSEAKMQHAAAQRRLYDGWCLYSAVRFECELGNVHPRYLSTIPLYVPPGASSDAPYGAAGADCPYPVLARGTGLSPRYDFGPEASPWSVLGLLARESGSVDPVTLVSLPFYMGFDASGQFRFEPFDANGLLPVIAYSDLADGGDGQILGEIHVYNSVAQMRSDIDFQGIDSLTGELLTAHITLPNDVRKTIGYHYPWLERNARYDDGYIQQMAQTAAQIASRPQQVVRFKALFQPSVYAGQKILVTEQKSLGGSGQFLIIEMRSRYGMRSLFGADGQRDCWSVITARRV